MTQTKPESMDMEQLAQRCVAHVQKRYGVELDFTSDTLSILDHYVVELVTDENRGVFPEPADLVRLNMIHLFAPTLGAYFGEMLAKSFGGRWRFTDKDPEMWRLEFDSFFLRFNPVGAAANTIAGHYMDNWASDFVTAPSMREPLIERLAAAPQVAVDDFYTFCSFFETVQIAHEFLKAVADKDGKMDCSPEGYDLILSLN